jgi:hypothetical protein
MAPKAPRQPGETRNKISHTGILWSDPVGTASPPPGPPPDVDRLLALMRKHGMETPLP